MSMIRCHEGTLRCRLLYWFVRVFKGGKQAAEREVRAQVANDMLQMIDSRTQHLAQRILLETK